MAQHVDKLLQCMALLREIATQHVGKMVEALGQRVSLTAYRDLVETIGVEPLPRQFEQSQLTEGIVERLSLGQSAHIVQAGVELHTAPTVALQTAAGLVLTFQHQHAASALCQLSGTNQSAQSATYHDDIVFHNS